MRYLKRLCSLTAIFALLLTAVLGLFQTRSLAAELSVSASPDRLSGSGNVRVTVNVTNTSEYEMRELRVTSNSGSKSFPGLTIAPGKSESLVVDGYYVDEGKLDTKIPFIIMWIENNELKTSAVNLVVGRSYDPEPTSITATEAPPDPVPDPVQTVNPTTDVQETASTESHPPVVTDYLSISVVADKQDAEKDGTVVFAYEVMNVSNEYLTNVTLRDEPVMGKKAHPEIKGITLAPNEKRTVNYTYTMGDDAVISSPTVSFTCAAGNMTQQGPTFEVKPLLEQTEVTVDVGETTEEGTVFTITITNNGSKTLRGILIRDEKGAIVADDESVSAGKSESFEYKVNPDETRDVVFTVTASGGFSYTTEAYSVYAYVDPSLVSVDFSIEVLEHLDENGYVVLQFTANNNGSLDLKNLMITEGDIEIGSMDDLAAGGTVTASYSVNVGASKNLNFTLTAYDLNEKPWEFETAITVDSFGGATQQQTSIRTNLNVGGAISNVLSHILIVLAVIAFLSGGTLITLAILEKRSNNGNGGRYAGNNGGNI